MSFAELKHLLTQYYLQHQGTCAVAYGLRNCIACLMDASVPSRMTRCAAPLPSTAPSTPAPNPPYAIRWKVAAAPNRDYLCFVTRCAVPLPTSAAASGTASSEGGTGSLVAAIASKVKPKWVAVRRAFKAFDVQGTNQVGHVQ